MKENLKCKLNSCGILSLSFSKSGHSLLKGPPASDFLLRRKSWNISQYALRFSMRWYLLLNHVSSKIKKQVRISDGWIVFKIYVNWAWTRFYVSQFAATVKFVNDNFPNLWRFFLKNVQIFVWFHLKSLKLWELSVKGVSYFRTEVNRNFMKG